MRTCGNPGSISIVRQPPGNRGGTLGLGVYQAVAQIFRPPVSGTLDYIKVEVTFPAGDNQLGIAIDSVDPIGGGPVDPFLVSAAVFPTVDVTSFCMYFQFAPTRLEGGKDYALRLLSDDPDVVPTRFAASYTERTEPGVGRLWIRNVAGWRDFNADGGRRALVFDVGFSQ